MGILDGLMGGVGSGVAGALLGGLFGGGKQSGTDNTTVSIDPELRNLFYGQNGLPSGTVSAGAGRPKAEEA